MNQLVKKAKRHDKEAFTKLMELNGKSMYKVAKAILENDEDVADAMQEAVLSCWEHIHTLKREEYFKTWMIRILINKCNVIYKQRKRFVADNNLPERGKWEQDYVNIEWMEFFQYLEEKYRTVVILYYVEGFKVREIAQILDISENTVKGRMVTARKKMEKLYNTERSWKTI